MLQAGTKQIHPGHVPDHLPAFPDPHAYIRTPVSPDNKAYVIIIFCAFLLFNGVS